MTWGSPYCSLVALDVAELNRREESEWLLWVLEPLESNQFEGQKRLYPWVMTWFCSVL
jgi:hypothetical protein